MRLLFVLLLTGCSTLEVVGGNGFEVDGSLLRPCDEQAVLANNPSPKQVLSVHASDSRAFSDCRKRFSIMQKSYIEYRKRIGKRDASAGQ